jgi:hypothetical protein
MRSIVADSVAHKARFAWLAGAFLASLVAFAVTRPEPEPDVPVWSIGHCVDAHGHVHAIRVEAVPSYR